MRKEKEKERHLHSYRRAGELLHSTVKVEQFDQTLTFYVILRHVGYIHTAQQSTQKKGLICLKRFRDFPALHRLPLPRHIIIFRVLLNLE